MESIINKTGIISYKDHRFNYPYKGFCSIVCGIVDMALNHYIENNNFNFKIEDSQVLNLFDDISPKTNEFYDVGPWFLQKFFSNSTYENQYNAHTPANFENLKLKNKIYSNILKIKDDYMQKFEYKKEKLKINKQTLAVQIRGTDKTNELPEIQIEKVFDLIDKSNKENIFVSTDDKKYLTPLIERYKNKIVYDDSISISENSKSLHHNAENRFKINEEVLSSVYLLSQCETFLYSFSNVSHLALIIGANNFKFVNHVN
jgi:hypothetical protein